MEKILWWRLPKLLIETLSAYSSLQLMSGLMYFLGVKTFLNIFKYSFSAIFNNVSPLCLSSKSLLLSSISDFRWDSEKKWMRQEWKEKNEFRWKQLQVNIFDCTPRKIHKYDNVSISVIHQNNHTTELLKWLCSLFCLKIQFSAKIVDCNHEIWFFEVNAWWNASIWILLIRNGNWIF